jgi:benzoyl-CoA reductase/2-hydroxyglutaryl-CoA dehydratase subunit BcrC/BadD/HgdB
LDYRLLWEIPGIWRGLEKLKELKSEIYRESKSFRGRTAEKIVDFAEEYLRINERIANTNTDLQITLRQPP